jgi:catechol 2,3-dioxygenase-like lactoylglutathione lyase family enzyme
MIRGVHHVAISTPDLERLAAFYVDVIGFVPVMSTGWENRPIVDRIIGVEGSAARQQMLQAGNAHLELFEYSSPVGASANPDRSPDDHGYTHFCLDVTDIDAEYERLRTAGMSFHSPPPTREELGNGSIRAIYARDPDGNIVELQEILDPEVPFALEQTPMIAAATTRPGPS